MDTRGMRHHGVARMKLLAAASSILLLGACSVAQYRQMVLADYSPTLESKNIDAVVAIETQMSNVGGDPSKVEAIRQVMAEDLAALFTHPSSKRGIGEELVLQASLHYHLQGLFPQRLTLEVTVSMLDPQTGATLASFTRSAQGVSFGRFISPGLLRTVMSGVKEDLTRAFEARKRPTAAPRPTPPPRVPTAPPVARPFVTDAGRVLYSNSWAVIIGINRYRKPGLRLQYAVNDAMSVRDTVVRLGFPPENVFLLLDEQATKQRIQELLGDQLRAQTAPDDRIFVFFAGHGVTVDLPGGGQMGYLLPVDADPDRLHATAIPMAEVRDISNLIPAKHIFFAIDACYSGLAAQRSTSLAPPRHIDPHIFVRGRLREILTAGERDQPVVEEAGHGVFTRRLLEGLAGEADFAPKDGIITGLELASWLIPRVQIASGNRQTPFFGKMEGVGEFIFVVTPGAASQESR